MAPPQNSVDGGPNREPQDAGEHLDGAIRRRNACTLKQRGGDFQSDRRFTFIRDCLVQTDRNLQHPFDVEGDEEISGGFRK